MKTIGATHRCRAFGLIVVLALGIGATVGAAPPTETKHLRVVVTAPDAAVAPGSRVSLALEITPKPTMHVYAPGQKEYVPISLTLEGDPSIKATAIQFPRAETRVVPGIETQRVYSKPFRVVQDVTVTATPAVRARARTPGATVVVKGTLRYQACDDTICYVPVNVPVAWTIALKSSPGVTP